jgi:hypothetical protein
MVYLGGLLTRADAGGSTCMILPWLSSAQTPAEARQRQARQEWVLMRVATIVLVLTDAAVLVIVSLIIATHS